MRNINLTNWLSRIVMGGALCSCIVVANANAKHVDTVFSCPGVLNTFATSINAKGTIVGYCYFGPHSFIRYADGSIETFAVEYNTYAMDLNAKIL